MDQVIKSVWSHYPDTPVIVETDIKLPETSNNVRSVGVGTDLRHIGSMISTKYVMWADDLDYVSNWTNIQRVVSRSKIKLLNLSNCISQD